MKKGLFMLVMTMITLVGCGKVYDFRDASWGMSLDDVKSVEDEHEHSPLNEDYEDMTIFKYPKVNVNGLIADVSYTFSNKVEKTWAYPEPSYHTYLYDYYNILYNYELPADERDQLLDRIESNVERLQAEYQNLPDTYMLSDSVLVSAQYFFYELDDEDKENIFNHLVNTHGKPIGGSTTYGEEGGVYHWFTNRTTITFFYNYLEYYGNNNALAEWILLE